MKRRIIALFLLLVMAFSLLTPANAQEISIIKDEATVLDFELLTDMIMRNYEITGSYSEQLVTIVTLQSWDGDLSGKVAKNVAKELHTRNLKNSIGMTIIFDIEQGNYGIIIGGRIKAMFDEVDAAKYLETHFHPHYEKGHYTAAVLSLSNALYRWYEQNYDQIPPPPWYTSPVFIVFAVIIFAILMYILYGIFARLAYLKHCFDAYYIERDLPIPSFGFRQIRSVPFYCSEDRSIWSFAGEIWKEEHPFLSCFEPLDVKRNVFDIIAVILKLVVLAFIWLILLLLTVLAGGGGHRSGSYRSSRSSSSSSSSSNRRSGSGSGGGGRSGGGGGGRR